MDLLVRLPGRSPCPSPPAGQGGAAAMTDLEVRPTNQEIQPVFSGQMRGGQSLWKTVVEDRRREI